MPVDPTPAAQPTSLFVHFEDHDQAVVIRLEGPSLGQREAAIIGDTTREHFGGITRKLRYVAIDLSDISMMSSMGVGYCIDIRNLARTRRAKPILFGMNRELRELFRMMKIERLFHLVHSHDDLQKTIRS